MIDAPTMRKLLLAELFPKIETAVERELRYLMDHQGDHDNWAVAFDEEAVIDAAVKAVEELKQW